MRMRPILMFLTVIAVLMMAYTFTLGLRFHYGKAGQESRMIAGESVSDEEIDAVGNLMPLHFVWGMGTGVFVCLIHSIVLTYFLGTGKAIREQMEIREWDTTEYDRWKKNMSASVIPACAGILLIMLAAFSGGFTMLTWIPPMMHLVLAAIGILLQIPVLMAEFAAIARNSALMDEIVDRVGEPLKMTL